MRSSLPSPDTKEHAMNTNCLEHIACPQCGNDSALKIAVTALAHVTDDGAETFGDLEWDDQSFAACPACGREGKLGEFRSPTVGEVHGAPAPALQREAGSMNAPRAAPMSHAVTIVIDGRPRAKRLCHQQHSACHRSGPRY